MADEELKAAIRKRGVIKGRLTHFKKHVADLKLLVQPDDENFALLDQKTLIELETRVQLLETLFQEFQEVQSKIELLVTEEAIPDQFAERQGFEDGYLDSLSQAKQIIANNYKLIGAAESIDGSPSRRSSALHSVHSATAARRTDVVQLPQIHIPKFSGSYNEFIEFRDTFEALIHSNPNLGDIERFHYLRASLLGEAKQAIRSLEFSAANYEAAWKSLCDRYNNSSLLRNNHLKGIFHFPKISRESAESLRNLIDTISKHLVALKTLGEATDSWDTVLIFLLAEKLDEVSFRDWERKCVKISNPKLDDFREFLKNKADLLETIESNKRPIKQVVKSHVSNSNSKGYANTLHSSSLSCPICQQSHYIQQCERFLKLSPADRLKKVKDARLCTNCLRGNHGAKSCSASFCRKCNSKHNTLLHIVEPDKPAVTPPSSSVDSESTNTSKPDNASTTLNNTVSYNDSDILLSTALVQVYDVKGVPQTCRVLLDNGSQSNIISSNLCQRLGLQKQPINFSVIGIGQTNAEVKFRCKVSIRSLSTSFKSTISCLVLPQIGGNLPMRDFDPSILGLPNNLKLADPYFYQRGSIDLLLGAELFYELIRPGQIKLGNDKPLLQETQLGWIISGRVQSIAVNMVQCHFVRNEDLQNQLTKFWEIEDISSSKILSKDDQACEDIFLQTTRRAEDGRFVVTIPLKQSPDKLGDSKQTAISRFHSLERRLQNNPQLKRMYHDFMAEYEQLDHMTELTQIPDNEITYYFPHHGVWNSKSATTKLRVVFNGSSLSDSGWSFNDIQYIGPKIQNDLLPILLRFRQHKVCMCADVEKMYRQILVSPSQRLLQLVLWRPNPETELKTFSLNTVTYGTASAPFLAIRCLRQLSDDFKQIHPKASEVVKTDFYMDDLLTGAETSSELISLCQDVNTILKAGGFHLRKWISNDPSLLSQLNVANTSDILQLGESENAKTLGLYWSSQSDSLLFDIRSCPDERPVTKRTVLSDIAHIFDPLGLLTPSTILAKIMLQKLWQLNLSWDEILPSDLEQSWLSYRSQLSYLNELRIPRFILCDQASTIELHGFADASQEAYGACIYIRSANDLGDVKVSLLCAKTRVAPLKPVTIPRLELCAAVILSQLAQVVRQSLTCKIARCFLWSDSTVALCWIKSDPTVLQPFVANRVVQIQNMTGISDWRHVSTQDNAADLLSRGVYPKTLRQSTLWWQGPTFLYSPPSSWPNYTPEVPKEIPELRKTIKVFATLQPEAGFPFDTFSKLNRLQRVVACLFRFVHNCRHPTQKLIGPIMPSELDNALTRLVRLSQQESFPVDFASLQRTKSLSKRSSLLNLTPFLDDKSIIRVGGRLQLSSFDYDKKHPILLSSKHHLTKLIFQREHIRLGHAGPQLLLASVRDQFWPLSGRNLARQVVHSCVRCSRCSPRFKNSIMGNLPESRVKPQPAFFLTGVDYAGPFSLKEKQGRGSKIIKGWLCLFICFNTKAVHLELVTSLSTQAFLATFRRFVSRRGKPQHVYSDNGTNFVGAKSELQKLGQFLAENAVQISDAGALESIEWHFIPAHSPHFGGLWEAGVKSAKHHLKRIMSNALLTYEEFSTVLTQVEAILNSRPLTPLSSEPGDLDALTPSHFLIGRKLTSLPDPNLQSIPENRLSRYQRLQQLQQHFWSRWAKEFISELQVRTKWKSNQFHLKEGDLVVIKQDDLPPMAWKLGRILQLHPGADGIARVATIKTASGSIKRSLPKLCVLPVNQ